MSRRNRTATTTQRGLGWDHQKQRAKLLRRLIDGTLCPLCNKEMRKATQDLDLDHALPRSLGGTLRTGVRLVHATCNRSRGNRLDWTPELPSDLDISRTW